MIIDRSKYETVTSLARLEHWVECARIAGAFAFDTETTGLDFMQDELVGIALAVHPGMGRPVLACYIPVGHIEGAQLPLVTVLDALQPILEHPLIMKIMQNGKFDMNIMARYGVRLSGIEDTMLLSSSISGGKHRHNMDELSTVYLQHQTLKYKEVAGNRPFSEVPLDLATKYSAEDADVTLRLFQRLSPYVGGDTDASFIYHRLELPLIPIISRMERRGVLVDVFKLNRLEDDFTAGRNKALDEAVAIAGHEFNPASPIQVAAVLQEMKVQLHATTPTGSYCVDSETLEELRNSVTTSVPARTLISSVLEWRKFAKLIGTYTQGLREKVNPMTNRVHPSFGMASTETGRLACSDPNLQNIPIRTKEGAQIREAFIAAPGHKLISADYSQIELRVLAVASGDEALYAAFENGLDIHQATASETWGVPYDQVSPEQRRAAKTVNFGLVYGKTVPGMAKMLNISTSDADAMIRRYFERFPGIKDYIAQAHAQADLNGYVKTAWGRKIWVPDVRSGNKGKRAHAFRAAQNAPIQGTAADIIKEAMIRVDRALTEANLETVMLLQVHDELVFEAPESEVEEALVLIKRVMEEPVDSIDVPLVVEAKAAENWRKAH